MALLQAFLFLVWGVAPAESSAPRVLVDRRDGRPLRRAR
jgi:hypothetical protein